MPKRDLFEELKSGLEDVRSYEKEKLIVKDTTSTKIEPRLLFVKKIHEIKEKIQCK